MTDEHTRRCPGITKAGKACAFPPAPRRVYCINHDPQMQERMHDARQRGGGNRSRAARGKKLFSKGVESLSDVQQVLMVALLDVIAGDLEPKVAHAVANLAGRIKDLQIGVDLEERVAELQRLTGELSERVG